MTTQTKAPMHIYTRRADQTIESPYEKPVILPMVNDHEPADHAWADARFATDIMAEHAFFFALLMPEELAAKERKQALEFAQTFGDLHKQIDAAAPPARSDLKSFTGKVIEQIKPLMEYKARLADAQRDGSLRSLVWPLFFDHTLHEAERWTRRLEDCGRGEPEFSRDEVVTFWANIMDEHCRFVAHLLDPDEFDLIDKAMKTSKVFVELGSGGVGATAKALVSEPATVVGSLIQNPETDAVLSAALTVLEFKTETGRAIEGARIKSIIDPRLADHVRREALKFVDELKRAV
jgi:Domain of unknown function (DUF2935)